MLETFLDRVQHHRKRCFTLLQVEALAPTVQQLLLRYLLACRDAAEPNLHCVQLFSETRHDSTALQAASWVTPHAGSIDKMDREKTSQALRPWCIDGHNISSLTYVTGPSGSGKTHWMRNKMTTWQAEQRECCIISITEAFSFEVATRQLHEKVEQYGAVRMGLCFHINLGKSRVQERAVWDALMHRINQFFFSLLVLQSVEDSTGFVFTVPPGCQWEVLIEIPDRAGHLDELIPTSPEESLWLELPVVACLGHEQTPSNEFELNEDTKLVCTYLKALHDGKIDTLNCGQHCAAKGDCTLPTVDQLLSADTSVFNVPQMWSLCLMPQTAWGGEGVSTPLLLSRCARMRCAHCWRRGSTGGIALDSSSLIIRSWQPTHSRLGRKIMRNAYSTFSRMFKTVEAQNFGIQWYAPPRCWCPTAATTTNGLSR
jgi:hypothetical protein